MFRLDKKTVLITGASGGIGGEIARTLHGAGATVALSGTRLAPLQALSTELGARVHVLPCDLSDLDEVTALPKQANEAMGSVDILINNAGITQDARLVKMTEMQFDAVIDVNLKGVFNCTQLVVPHMLEAKRGAIVNASSVVGLYGNFGQTNYSATKYVVPHRTGARWL